MPAQVLGGYSSNVSSLTGYIPAFAGMSSQTQSTGQFGASVLMNFPAAGTVSDFSITLGTAPGTGKSRTFTLYKNGSSTSVSITISDTDTFGADLSNSVSISAGDSIQIYTTSSGIPLATTVNHSAKFTPTTDSEYFLGGYFTNNLTNSRYIGIGVTTNLTITEAQAFMVAPCAGTISGLFVRCSDPPRAGRSGAVTVRQNSSNTSLSVSLSESTAYGQDTSNSFTVAAGDLLSVYISGSLRGTITWSFIYSPSNSSHVPYIMSTPPTVTFGTGDGRLDNAYNLTAVSGNYQLESQSFVAMYAYVATAPGTGKSRTFTLEIDGTGSGLSAVISDTSNSGNGSHAGVDTVSGDILTIGCSSSGTPASSGGTIGLVCLSESETVNNVVLNIITNF